MTPVKTGARSLKVKEKKKSEQTDVEEEIMTKPTRGRKARKNVDEQELIPVEEVEEVDKVEQEEAPAEALEGGDQKSGGGR